VLAILPEESRRKAEQSRLFAPDFGAQGYSKAQFDLVHRAVSGQQVLALHYRDEAGKVSQRDVLPLGLFSGASAGCW
jgi:predicted DNA-binding transcriptional regulator YafY